MKASTKSLSLFLLISSFFPSLSISTPQSALSENHPSVSWSGEWVGGGERKLFGLSVEGCPISTACRVSLFELSGFSPSCLREGLGEIAADGKQMKIEIKSNRMNSIEECHLLLERNDTGGLKLLRSTDPSAICTLRSCEPISQGEERVYKKVSEKVFLRQNLSWGKCFEMTSAAARVWCSDAELQDIVAQADKVPYAETEWNWGIETEIFRRCEAAAEIKQCLVQEFRAKLQKLQSESDERAASYLTPGDKAEAKQILSRISGVYKKRFMNNTVSDEPYQSEDILEVVPVADDAAYIKTSLDFFNGHVCNAFGIFEYKSGGGFVLRDTEKGNKCLLTLKLEKDRVVFEDPTGVCKNRMCGARGSFNDVGFPVQKRRTIRYMKIIENSEDYKSSLAEYRQVK